MTYVGFRWQDAHVAVHHVKNTDTNTGTILAYIRRKSLISLQLFIVGMVLATVKNTDTNEAYGLSH